MKKEIIEGGRDLTKHPFSKEELIEIEEIKRGRGIVAALPLEEWLWLLRGSDKLDRIVEAAGMYNDKVNRTTLSKYFYPIPESIDEAYKFVSINHFITACNEDLHWTDKYKDLMFVVTW